jgi:hypothetical protein
MEFRARLGHRTGFLVKDTLALTGETKNISIYMTRT